MIIQRLKQINRDNSGVAMIVAMIVGVVVMIFCLSLLLVTYTFYTQTVKTTTNEQCKMLAQSFSETLGKDMEDPDSDICLYLGEQMKNGYWVASVVDEDETLSGDQVSDLIVDMKDTPGMGDYHISVVFSFIVNIPEDDENDGNEEDDQDDGLTDENPSESNPGEGGAPQDPEENGPTGPVEGGSYCIRAKIQCYRGELSSNDVPLYIETEYPMVTFR